MKKHSILLLILVSIQCFGQISSKVLDGKTKLPIPYVNIWAKKPSLGTTTNENGIFHLDKGKPGDTLLISHLGYQYIQIIAKENNKIILSQTKIELEEIVVTPMKNKKTLKIKSYKNHKKIREFNFFEHQACARFFEYKVKYANTLFIKKVALPVITPKDGKQLIRVYLMKVDKEGRPSNQIFSAYKNVEIYEDGEITVDFADERIKFPKEGFFVVFDILDIKENRLTNKYGRVILCPAIGMENKEQKKNTWLGYGRKWVNPSERKKTSNEDRNIAINIELSN